VDVPPGSPRQPGGAFTDLEDHPVVSSPRDRERWMYRRAASGPPDGTFTLNPFPSADLGLGVRGRPEEDEKGSLPELLGAPVPARYPYELKLPLAPYRFVWRDEPAVDAEKTATELFTQERYTHADGTTTIIREYGADGSFHIMSDRGEIELIDNAQDPYAADPVSVVRLP
jgi:hypothetical protein